MAIQNEQGKLRYGFFTEPVGSIDVSGIELRSPLGELLAGDVKEQYFKQFQFLGAVSNELALGCAFSSSDLVQGCFVYVCDMQQKTLQQLRVSARPGDEFRLSRNPDEGRSIIQTDKARIVMESSPDLKQLKVESEDLSIELAVDETHLETQRICTRAGPVGFSYAQKVAGVPATGRVVSSLGTFELSEGVCGHHDFTAGFLQHELWWHWACISGIDSAGHLIGLNLSCGTNETSFSENCLWLDGEIHRLGGALFEFDPDDWDQSWRVRTVDGALNLVFEPAQGYHSTGGRDEVASNFHQLFGHYSGHVDLNGKAIEVRRLPGFAESQYLKW